MRESFMNIEQGCNINYMVMPTKSKEPTFRENMIEFSVLPRERLIIDIEKKLKAVERFLLNLSVDLTES